MTIVIGRQMVRSKSPSRENTTMVTHLHALHATTAKPPPYTSPVTRNLSDLPNLVYTHDPRYCTLAGTRTFANIAKTGLCSEAIDLFVIVFFTFYSGSRFFFCKEHPWREYMPPKRVSAAYVIVLGRGHGVPPAGLPIGQVLAEFSIT